MRKDFLSLPTNASDPDPACLALLLRNKEYSQQHLKEKMNSKMKRMDVLCSAVQYRQRQGRTPPSMFFLISSILLPKESLSFGIWWGRATLEVAVAVEVAVEPVK